MPLWRRYIKPGSQQLLLATVQVEDESPQGMEAAFRELNKAMRDKTPNPDANRLAAQAGVLLRSNGEFDLDPFLADISPSVPGQDLLRETLNECKTKPEEWQPIVLDDIFEEDTPGETVAQVRAIMNKHCVQAFKTEHKVSWMMFEASLCTLTSVGFRTLPLIPCATS